MRNLFKILLRYHFVILFFVIELFSLFLVIQNNHYQRASFLKSTNFLSGRIYSLFDSFSQYLSLKEANEELVQENKYLYNNLKSFYFTARVDSHKIVDNEYKQQWEFIDAQVINTSSNKQSNYLTINKGRSHGLEAEMAVIGPKGVIGVIKDVSSNFATVIPILNKNLSISAKIKRNNYYGSLVWNGVDFHYAKLNEIAYHVQFFYGDTVVTSGFSAIFPEGINIGTIYYYSKKEGRNFYDITVKLSTDFKSISNVYVIKNLMKIEQTTLEEKATND